MHWHDAPSSVAASGLVPRANTTARTREASCGAGVLGTAADARNTAQEDDKVPVMWPTASGRSETLSGLRRAERDPQRASEPLAQARSTQLPEGRHVVRA